jgi:hypothetical protein
MKSSAIVAFMSLGAAGNALAADPMAQYRRSFGDDTTADAGLNNYVYTLKKH